MNNSSSIDLNLYHPSGVPLACIEALRKAEQEDTLSDMTGETNFPEGYSTLHFKDGTVLRFDHHPSTISVQK
jgi:hypothetical protein